MEPIDRISQRRFEELLPFFVQGKCLQDDALWMQNMLLGHPSLQEHLEAEKQLHQMFVSTAQARQPNISSDAGFAMVQDKIRALQGAQDRPLWWQKAWRVPIGWLAGLTGLAGLGLAQLAYFVFFAGGIALAPSRSVPLECRLEPQVRITLRPDARWEEAAILMRKHSLVIRQGPNEMGQIWLAVSADNTAESAAAALSAERLVETAQVSEAIPSPGCRAGFSTLPGAVKLAAH